MSSVAAYVATARAKDAAPDMNEVVKRHAPLVKRIAYHLISRLPPSVQVDDLIQAGMIGLLALLPRARAAGVIRHLPAVSSPVERRLDRYIAPPHLRRFHRNGPVRSTPVRSRKERTISDR